VIIDGVSVTAVENDIIIDSTNVNTYKWNGSKWVLYVPVAKLKTHMDSFSSDRSTPLRYLNFIDNSFSNTYIGGLTSTDVYYIKVGNNLNRDAYFDIKSMYDNRELLRLDVPEYVTSLNKPTSTDSNHKWYVFNSGTSKLKIVVLPYNGVVNCAGWAGLNPAWTYIGMTDTNITSSYTHTITLHDGTEHTFTTGEYVGSFSNNEYWIVENSGSSGWSKMSTHGPGHCWNGSHVDTGAADVKIYVPRAQIDNYKVAPGWNAIYIRGQANNNPIFYALEDMPT
jgi:hypothetical protein